MLKLIKESIIVGIVTAIIGSIIFYFTIYKIKKCNNNKKNNNFNKIIIAFFMTGVVLHIILNKSGFNKWQCDKQTMTGICRLSML